jgi:hypothetical protein
MDEDFTLITGRPIQHAEDFQDVAVAIIAMELVARSIKAQDDFPRFPMRTVRMAVHRHCGSWARWKISRKELLGRFNVRVNSWAGTMNVALVTTRYRQVEVIHRLTSGSPQTLQVVEGCHNFLGGGSHHGTFATSY